MNVIFSDEQNKLTSEMKALMEQAAAAALSMEFGEEIGAAGFAVEDARAELGVTVCFVVRGVVMRVTCARMSVRISVAVSRAES